MNLTSGQLNSKGPLNGYGLKQQSVLLPAADMVHPSAVATYSSGLFAISTPIQNTVSASSKQGCHNIFGRLQELSKASNPVPPFKTTVFFLQNDSGIVFVF